MCVRPLSLPGLPLETPADVARAEARTDLKPEEVLAVCDARRYFYVPRYLKQDKAEWLWRHEFIKHEDLDILLPLCRVEYLPIDLWEFRWLKLKKSVGTWVRSVTSGVRSALRTAGTSPTARR